MTSLLFALALQTSAQAQELQALGAPSLAPSGPAAGPELKRHVITDPRAVCNDGSPAVMYVRHATDPAHENDWIFVFEGGGTCLADNTDEMWQRCGNRWTGDSAFRMSTDPGSDGMLDVPLGIVGKGILQAGAAGFASDFGDWNQVFLNYCSSDGWTGRSDVLFLDHSVVGNTDYHIRFRGRDIVDGAIADLWGGGITDFTEAPLPPFQNATRLVVAGESAGGSGVAFNVDHMAGYVPNAKAYAIMGANFKPRPKYLDPGGFFQAHFQNKMDVIYPTIRAGLDQSCLDDASLGLNAYWKCASATEIAVDHLSTPIFVRMDVTDPLVSDNYLALGATLEQFAEGVERSLWDLPWGSGWFGPQCARHMGNNTDRWYFANWVNDPATGLLYSYHDAIAEWVTNPGSFGVSDTTPGGVLSFCPPP